MRFTTADVIASQNDAEMDGLTHVSFGGPDDTFFQMCRQSSESLQGSKESDRGIADIYSVINDQSRAADGGIIQCVLTNTSFSITFDHAASSQLKDDRVDVEFSATKDVLGSLRDALNCIFRGSGKFSDQSNLE